ETPTPDRQTPYLACVTDAFACPTLPSKTEPPHGPINTVGAPITIESGGPAHWAASPTRAAGSPPIKTVGEPGPVIGPPTCGLGPSNIGQACMSVTRAAGCPAINTVGNPATIAPPCAV